MCIYIHRHNLLTMTNAAYMYGFRADHLYWITSELTPWEELYFNHHYSFIACDSLDMVEAS